VVARNFEVARDGGAVKLFQSHRNDYADGGQKRDFIHVDDVVDVIVWCLEKGPAHGLFNVGTGQAASFRELIEALFAAVGQPTNIAYVPMPESLRPRYQYFTEAPMASLRAAGYAAPFAAVGPAVAKYVRYLGGEDRYR
jgi:ADP-L-glycero-D-manno-heptose 6-epimerase